MSYSIKWMLKCSLEIKKKLLIDERKYQTEIMAS
jgi:hypothetical protein